MIKSKFIIVEHHATKARLHWDLRFRIPNSKNWISFAVRKGVPTQPGKRVLAVRTHDHSEQEALFLGKIPEGEYGAGVLKKWDDGDCIIHKFKPGHITVEFKGRKIKGIYHLVNTGVTNRKKFKKQQYMLFKGKIISEMMGMAGRIPSGGIAEDTEEGTTEETGGAMPWSHKK